ncbi:MAG: tRNA1(Val) (adenine(37)-N6)-methyltransferase [Syntrophobacteraceae bacterium]
MLTSDALFDGRLTVCQEQKGYRFSLDAVLLAGLTHIRRDDRVIELGTGCGIISLILAYKDKTEHKITAVEIQPELAELAQKNVCDNHFDHRIEVHRRDFRQAAPAGENFDLVLSNPPYRKPGTGRINPDKQKAIARHELTATAADVFKAAQRLVPTGGRVALVYPATRLATLLGAAQGHGFSPKRLTVIHSRAHGPGRLVHLECRKGSGEGLTVEPPFFVYDEQGRYSPAMRELYRCAD